jgi:hypothetical protein
MATTAPHGIATGDIVQVDGHAVNTGANGYYVVGAVGAVHSGVPSVSLAGVTIAFRLQAWHSPIHREL